MKLPNYQQALVRQAKITDYLLSLSHSSGRSKAKFFRSYGFTCEHWPELAQALKTLVTNYEVTKVELTAFGTRYVIEGLLNTPDSRNPLIRTVWFIETGQTTPPFVTAYPHG